MLMPKPGNQPIHLELLQLTLDLLILGTLTAGPAHGHTIAHVIEHQSYRITPAGRTQLQEQTTRWEASVRAINQVWRPA